MIARNGFDRLTFELCQRCGQVLNNEVRSDISGRIRSTGDDGKVNAIFIAFIVRR